MKATFTTTTVKYESPRNGTMTIRFIHNSLTERYTSEYRVDSWGKNGTWKSFKSAKSIETIMDHIRKSL